MIATPSQGHYNVHNRCDTARIIIILFRSFSRVALIKRSYERGFFRWRLWVYYIELSRVTSELQLLLFGVSGSLGGFRMWCYLWMVRSSELWCRVAFSLKFLLLSLLRWLRWSLEANSRWDGGVISEINRFFNVFRNLSDFFKLILFVLMKKKLVWVNL